MKAIAVTGGRDYANKQKVYGVLDALHRGESFDLLVQGGALGADSLAEAWARERSVPFATVPADWARYGKGAGPKRNARMLELFKPVLLVAFSGGRGTRNCIETACSLGIEVLPIQG